MVGKMAVKESKVKSSGVFTNHLKWIRIIQNSLVNIVQSIFYQP